MKHFAIIVSIIIVTGAVLYLFKDKLNWQTSFEQINPGSKPTTLMPMVSGQNQNQQGQANAPAPGDVTYVAAHFAQLAKDFDTNTPFTIKRIWLQDSNMFYVEYQNSKSALAQILVVKENGSFTGRGYFAPSESGWVLQAGEGDLIKSSAVFYEKDATGMWIRKN